MAIKRCSKANYSIDLYIYTPREEGGRKSAHVAGWQKELEVKFEVD